MTIRLNPIKDAYSRNALWRTLYSISEPVTLTINIGESVPDAIARTCGSVSDDLLTFSKGLNPDEPIAAMPDVRDFKFIPCPFWLFDTDTHRLTVPVSQDANLTDIMSFQLGATDVQVEKTIIKMNSEILSEDGRILRSGNLRIPYITKGFTISLNSAFKNKPNEAMGKITASSLSTATDRALNRSMTTALQGYRFVAQDMAAAASGPSSCAGPSSSSNWPFDLQQVRQLVESDAARYQLSAIPVVALIADTGLDVNIPEVRGMLWINKRVVANMPDWQMYHDDLNGADLVDQSGNLTPSPDYTLAMHGTEVAEIITGGPQSAGVYSDFVRIAGGKITIDKEPYSIERAAFYSAFKYGTLMLEQNRDAVVLNLSAVSTGLIDGLSDALHATSFLVVAAAGNNGQKIDVADVYPPAYTVDRKNLIVVGAHDWNGEITDFSNRGELVDLLAPGCLIPIRLTTGDQIYVSGTSFSTPFVTLTATLLTWLGFTPAQVKNRILASVDFDPKLYSLVKSGGRLNIIKALSVYDDIIVLKDQGMLMGELADSQSWFCVRGQAKDPFRPDTLSKLVTNYPAGGQNLVKLTKRAGAGGIDYDEALCDRIEGSLLFRKTSSTPIAGVTATASTGAPPPPFVVYDWANVLDVVPAIVHNPGH